MSCIFHTLGSLLYLVEPGSNILASFMQPYIGRKFGLIVAFIPQFISGVSIPLFRSVSILYLAEIFHGISAGFLSVPVFAYYGEISEPRIRGILTGSYYVTICFGMLMEFLLGSIFHWKLTAAINTVVPIIGIISIACVSTFVFKQKSIITEKKVFEKILFAVYSLKIKSRFRFSFPDSRFPRMAIGKRKTWSGS